LPRWPILARDHHSHHFLLKTLFKNGGIAILFSALSALYQMTFARFFVHLSSIQPAAVVRVSVNEVRSGLQIQDRFDISHIFEEVDLEIRLDHTPHSHTVSCRALVETLTRSL
jgi:hypothetical protein